MPLLSRSMLLRKAFPTVMRLNNSPVRRNMLQLNGKQHNLRCNCDNMREHARVVVDANAIEECHRPHARKVSRRKLFRESERPRCTMKQAHK